MTHRPTAKTWSILAEYYPKMRHLSSTVTTTMLEITSSPSSFPLTSTTNLQTSTMHMQLAIVRTNVVFMWKSHDSDCTITMGFKGDAWAIPGAVAGVFKVEKSHFHALWLPKKFILRVLFISEGCKMKEKACGSSFEVSETRYIALRF